MLSTFVLVRFGGDDSSFHSGIEFGRSRTGKGLRGEGRMGWCEEWDRSGLDHPTFHIISARPPKQTRMVRTFLNVHKRPRLTYVLR